MNRQQLSSPWKTKYSDFNYDHVDPETLKEWEAEFRRKNWSDMRSYLKQFRGFAFRAGFPLFSDLQPPGLQRAGKTPISASKKPLPVLSVNFRFFPL